MLFPMQSMAPEQARFLLEGLYLPRLKHEHQMTRRVIEAIPLDKGDYRPDQISRTALELAWHITVTEMRFMDSVLSGEFDLAPRSRPESIKNSTDLLNWYTSEFEAHVDKLKQLSADQLTKIVDFRGILKEPAVFFLGLLLHHSIHHRGQLSMYLRPMGAKVPAIYGESYDSAQARQQAV